MNKQKPTNTEEQREFLKFMQSLGLVSESAIYRPIKKSLWFFGKMLMSNDVVAFQKLALEIAKKNHK